MVVGQVDVKRRRSSSSSQDNTSDFLMSIREIQKFRDMIVTILNWGEVLSKEWSESLLDNKFIGRHELDWVHSVDSWHPNDFVSTYIEHYGKVKKGHWMIINTNHVAGDSCLYTFPRNTPTYPYFWEFQTNFEKTFAYQSSNWFIFPFTSTIQKFNRLR